MSETACRLVFVDAVMASLHFKLKYGVSIPPATIRKWASRGKVTSHPREHRYVVRQLEKYAAGRGLIAE